MHDEDNDGKFPDESPVEVRYPRSKQEEHGDREPWPCLPGTIVEQCGPDEWYVFIEVRELAPQWMGSLVRSLGAVSLDTRSVFVLDSLNNLSSFSTKVKLNDFPILMRVRGKVDGAAYLFVGSGFAPLVGICAASSTLFRSVPGQAGAAAVVRRCHACL